mgnify:CR=1 FL=1
MGPRPTNLTPETAAKYRKVLDLRVLGFTFDSIAEQVGYNSRSGAFEAYRAALKWWSAEAVSEARQFENERLERLWLSSMQQLVAAERECLQEVIDKDGNVQRQSTYSRDVQTAIFGAGRLDAPKQLEVTGLDGGPIVTDIGEVLRKTMEEVMPGSTRLANSLPQGDEEDKVIDVKD